MEVHSVQRDNKQNPIWLVAGAESKEDRLLNLNKDGWCCTTFAFAGKEKFKGHRFWLFTQYRRLLSEFILPSDGIEKEEYYTKQVNLKTTKGKFNIKI